MSCVEKNQIYRFIVSRQIIFIIEETYSMWNGAKQYKVLTDSGIYYVWIWENDLELLS